MSSNTEPTASEQNSRRNLMVAVAAVTVSGAAALALPRRALAEAQQQWPTKTVTLLVPFPPGGSTDALARAISPALSATFGQTFIVDNKPGATGTIGTSQVKRAPPDGYLFLVTSLGPLVIAPHLLRSTPYDAMKDLDPVTVAVQAPNVLVVPATSPHKSVANVIEWSKANPGKMTLASSGTGSSDHLTAELFWQQSGTTGSHVPYKGGAPAITDLIGGQVDASFQNVNAVLQHIRGNKLRALAVTGAKRTPVLPDIPTLDEAGVLGVNVHSWQAISAPKGLPDDIKSRFHDAVVSALKEPKLAEQFTALGFEIVANTPAQFAEFQEKENARWKQLIESRKISAD